MMEPEGLEVFIKCCGAKKPDFAEVSNGHVVIPDVTCISEPDSRDVKSEMTGSQAFKDLIMRPEVRQINAPCHKSVCLDTSQIHDKKDCNSEDFMPKAIQTNSFTDKIACNDIFQRDDFSTHLRPSHTVLMDNHGNEVKESENIVMKNSSNIVKESETVLMDNPGNEVNKSLTILIDGSSNEERPPETIIINNSRREYITSKTVNAKASVDDVVCPETIETENSSSQIIKSELSHSDDPDSQVFTPENQVENFSGQGIKSESSHSCELGRLVSMLPQTAGTSDTRITCVIAQKDREIAGLHKLITRYGLLLEVTSKYNGALRQELSQLRTQLSSCQSCSLTRKTASTQVCELEITEACGDKPMPNWATDSSQLESQNSIADIVRAAAEEECQNQLYSAADNPGLESGQCTLEQNQEYVYDNSSGLYYHPASGYYWEPNYGLFYDCTTGTYYKYNDTSGTYEVHSQVDVTGENSTTQVKTKKRKVQKARQEESKGQKQHKKLHRVSLVAHADGTKYIRKRKIRINDEIVASDKLSSSPRREEQDPLIVDNPTPEEGKNEVPMDINPSSDCESEYSGSLATDESELVSDLESGELSSGTTGSLDEADIFGQQQEAELVMSSDINSCVEEIAENYPPCIRLIVQSSDHLPLGSLSVITCAGGTLGKDKPTQHAVNINDDAVSKTHAAICYDYDRGCYLIRDLGSQNGTFLNGFRLSTQSRLESSQFSVHHQDQLRLGSTTFLLHIHPGSQTCDDCEPGQVHARIKAASAAPSDRTILSSGEKNMLRKKELKNIKKKYGLENMRYEVGWTGQSNPKYTDKAHLRRKTNGSEPATVDSPVSSASVHRPISELNKGHKMLAKLGWKEGQGLGKLNSGITQPVNVELRVNQSAGLGSSVDVSVSLDSVQEVGKTKRWVQARKRYDQLQGVTSDQPLPEGGSETYPSLNS